MFGKTNSKFQNENTKFNPQSPYAIAKSSAYFTIKYYRETYGLFASTALIIMNHREEQLIVSRKITSSVVKILEKINKTRTRRYISQDRLNIPGST